MSDRLPEQEQLPDAEAPAITGRFVGYLTLGGFVLTMLVFANGLPGMLGWPLIAVTVPTPTARAAPTMVPVATVSVQSTWVPVAPTATSAPLVAAPSPTPVTGRLVVGNTNGDGVSLRRTAKLNDRWVAWQDGTVMEIIGPDATGDGLTWRHVRDPRGNTGYIPAQYLIPLADGR